jgi:hypothetical protein
MRQLLRWITASNDYEPDCCIVKVSVQLRYTLKFCYSVKCSFNTTGLFP